MKPIIIVCGADRCGKTEIAKALSSRLCVPYYKASDEHRTFLHNQDKFLNDLRYADPARLDLLKQLNTGLVFDRSFPCEAVYSKYFGRQTDDAMLTWLDAQYAALNTHIVLCRRTNSGFRDVVDDLDPSLAGDSLVKLSDMYEQFLAKSKCHCMRLYVDDENLVREIDEIIGWMNDIAMGDVVEFFGNTGNV
jgi:hypothetical protein